MNEALMADAARAGNIEAARKTMLGCAEKIRFPRRARSSVEADTLNIELHGMLIAEPVNPGRDRLNRQFHPYCAGWQ
jgi:hypothetical protein